MDNETARADPIRRINADIENSFLCVMHVDREIFRRISGIVKPRGVDPLGTCGDHIAYHALGVRIAPDSHDEHIRDYLAINQISEPGRWWVVIHVNSRHVNLGYLSRGVVDANSQHHIGVLVDPPRVPNRAPFGLEGRRIPFGIYILPVLAVIEGILKVNISCIGSRVDHDGHVATHAIPGLWRNKHDASSEILDDQAKILELDGDAADRRAIYHDLNAHYEQVIVHEDL